MSGAKRNPAIARPFPWGSLDSTTRAEIDTLAAARRWAAGHVKLSAIEDALCHLAGANVEVAVRRARLRSEAGGFGEGVGAILSSAEQPANVPLALVEVERALATELVARAIRRPPPVVVDTAAAGSAAIAGAFAAVLIAAARRSHAGTPLRVVAAGEAGAIEADFACAGDPIAIALTVLVADNAYAARVLLAPSVTAAPPPLVWTRSALSRMGSTPLAMPVVACAARLAIAEMATLRRGDVVIPSSFPLTQTARGGEWVGPVRLAAPGGATAIRADLGEGGRLVLRGDMVPLEAVEADMDESDASPAIVDAVGEIPVIVRVEIGQAQMLAREWAALDRGDVIALGHRVGERVVLRVGGVRVAHGELVEIDGEVGVRVVERLVEEPRGS